MKNLLLAMAVVTSISGCATNATTDVTPSAQRSDSAKAGPNGASSSNSKDGPKKYSAVITDEAVSREGVFKTHLIGDKLFFEIPTAEFGSEMMMISRAVESTLQSPSGFFGGGVRRLVRWERHGDNVVLRGRSYNLVADSTENIYRQVKGFQNQAVVGRFPVAAYNPDDSSAVIDVSDLFLTFNREMGSIQGTQKAKSWFEHVASFERNIEVEATQTGSARAPGASSTTPASSQTARIHWSLLKLPDEPMRCHGSVMTEWGSTPLRTSTSHRASTRPSRSASSTDSSWFQVTWLHFVAASWSNPSSRSCTGLIRRHQSG